MCTCTVYKTVSVQDTSSIFSVNLQCCCTGKRCDPTTVRGRTYYKCVAGMNNLVYYTSREFPIQNFHRRTTDILYDGECCHVFAIAAGDIIKYQGGHMMLSIIEM